MDHLRKEDILVLLNKCWMTHDGMWFLSCFNEFGIEKTNKMNKAAISGLAPIEVKRFKDILGMGDQEIDNFEAFKVFFKGAGDLVIPDFMNAEMSFPRENVLHWRFKTGKCFAFRGMQMIGALEGYECGVIHRIESWVKCLGIAYTARPDVTGCLMRDEGKCEGELWLDFG